MEKLEARGLADVRRYAKAEGELVQTVFLLETYHRYCRDFDQLIVDQVKLGPTLAPVKFAGEALRQMRKRGIGAAEAARYFAMFYQLRRAYHFIVRGLIGQKRLLLGR